MFPKPIEAFSRSKIQSGLNKRSGLGNMRARNNSVHVQAKSAGEKREGRRMKGEAGRSYADRAIVVPFQMLKAFFIENSFSK
jgi:hypothetical protein